MGRRLDPQPENTGGLTARERAAAGGKPLTAAERIGPGRSCSAASRCVRESLYKTPRPTEDAPAGRGFCYSSRRSASSSAPQPSRISR